MTDYLLNILFLTYPVPLAHDLPLQCIRLAVEYLTFSSQIIVQITNKTKSHTVNDGARTILGALLYCDSFTKNKLCLYLDLMVRPLLFVGMS